METLLGVVTPAKVVKSSFKKGPTTWRETSSFQIKRYPSIHSLKLIWLLTNRWNKSIWNSFSQAQVEKIMIHKNHPIIRIIHISWPNSFRYLRMRVLSQVLKNKLRKHHKTIFWSRKFSCPCLRIKKSIKKVTWHLQTNKFKESCSCNNKLGSKLRRRPIMIFTPSRSQGQTLNRSRFSPNSHRSNPNTLLSMATAFLVRRTKSHLQGEFLLKNLLYLLLESKSMTLS